MGRLADHQEGYSNLSLLLKCGVEDAKAQYVREVQSLGMASTAGSSQSTAEIYDFIAAKLKSAGVGTPEGKKILDDLKKHDAAFAVFADNSLEEERYMNKESASVTFRNSTLRRGSNATPKGANLNMRASLRETWGGTNARMGASSRYSMAPDPFGDAVDPVSVEIDQTSFLRFIPPSRKHMQ